MGREGSIILIDHPAEKRPRQKPDETLEDAFTERIGIGERIRIFLHGIAEPVIGTLKRMVPGGTKVNGSVTIETDEGDVIVPEKDIAVGDDGFYQIEKDQ